MATLPNDIEVQSAYGRMLAMARAGDKDRAIQAFQKAIDLGSKSAELRAQLARTLLEKGQVTAAIELYKQSILLDPYFTPAYLDLGRVFSMLKDRKSALEMLDRALTIDPGTILPVKSGAKSRPCPMKTGSLPFRTQESAGQFKTKGSSIISRSSVTILLVHSPADSCVSEKDRTLRKPESS